PENSQELVPSTVSAALFPKPTAMPTRPSPSSARRVSLLAVFIIHSAPFFTVTLAPEASAVFAGARPVRNAELMPVTTMSPGKAGLRIRQASRTPSFTTVGPEYSLGKKPEMSSLPGPLLVRPPGPEMTPAQQSKRPITLRTSLATRMLAVRWSAMLPLQVLEPPRETRAAEFVEFSVSGSSRTQRGEDNS